MIIVLSNSTSQSLMGVRLAPIYWRWTMRVLLNNKNTKHFDQKIKERSTDCHCSHERCKAD